MRKMYFLISFLLLITVLLCPAMAADDTTPPTLVVNVVAENGTVKVYGTAMDESGVDRVEVKINDGGWKTANLSGNNFSYSEDLNATGNHVSSVRAFDSVGNPTAIDLKTFYSQRKTFSADNDLSFFVRLASVKLTALNLSGNVREMEYSQDFGISFDVVNDDSVSHKLRYIIDVNGEEQTEDLTVSAERSKTVDEWFGASMLNVGQNRIKISLIDWETRQTVVDKTIILNVKTAEKPVNSNESAEVPVWLKEFAELNGLVLPRENVGAVENAALEVKIAELESKVRVLESAFQAVPVVQGTDWSGLFWPGAVALIAIVFLVLLGSGKFNQFVKKKDSSDDEFQEN